MSCGRLRLVDDTQLDGDLMHVLVTKEELAARISELAAEIDRDYAGKDLLLVGVLNGAVMVMADLSRALTMHCRMDWMAVSSYGSGSQSSRRLDSQTVEILRTCASGGWTKFIRRLSTNPKELVLEITEQQADGRRAERRLVMEKQ